MFDVPSELENEIGTSAVFRAATELPALEEMHFADERRFDDRQRASTRRPFMPGGDYHGYRRQTPRASGRHNSAFSQRFSGSSYWKNQPFRRSRDSLWESDDE